MYFRIFFNRLKYCSFQHLIDAISLVFVVRFIFQSYPILLAISYLARKKDKFLQKSELSRKCPQANAVTLSYLRPHRRDTLDMEPWRQPSLDRHDTNSDRPMSQNW